jgi:anti-sigma factor RsiW
MWKEEHLKTEDFFLLAFPPSGEPEELAPHLTGCSHCRRQFAQWRAAAEGFAAPASAPSPGIERSVMAKIRSMRPLRSRRTARGWFAGISAAACLLVAFGLGLRLGRQATPTAPGTPIGSRVASVTAMSAADRKDDELLRDVSRLVSNDDDENDWRSLAPLPAAPGGNS